MTVTGDKPQTALQYRVNRLDELVTWGQYVLTEIGQEGNIDNHDRWFVAAHSFLAINGPDFLPKLNSIASKYTNDILGPQSARATYHLIQEQIEVLRQAQGHFAEILKVTPEPSAIYAALRDQELRERCSDLLTASTNFDRVVNQATLVLEDRIRKRSGLNDLQGVGLVNKALNSKRDDSILKVSNDPQIHEGICHICRGIVLAFRNPTHHQIIEAYSREDALKLCAFIDNLLSIIEQATL